MTERRREKTREGAKRMKRGKGIKGLDDKSNGTEILMTEVFVKIKPTTMII
jgi:hypothetical protein